MKGKKRVWMFGFLFVFAVMACEREGGEKDDATAEGDARDTAGDTARLEPVERETHDMRDASETADMTEEVPAEDEDSLGNEADEEADEVEEGEITECGSPGEFQCVNPGQLGRCSESGVLEFYAQCQPHETCIDGSCVPKPIDDTSTTTTALLESCGLCGETTLSYYVDLETFLPANCPGIRGVSNPTEKIREALAIWENATGGRVHFVQVGNLSDAKIRILCGRAEDWCSAWGALGCAYPPSSCADIAGTSGFTRWIMVDERDLPWEGWNNDLFVYTLAHEAGHTLGLGHSPNWFGDLMSPFASSGYPPFTCTDLELFNGVWKSSWSEECDLDGCLLYEMCGDRYVCPHCTCPDEDGDGHLSVLCPEEGRGYCTASIDDCDDVDPNTYFGAPEILDGKDNDCDRDRDEGLCPSNYCQDQWVHYGRDKTGWNCDDPCGECPLASVECSRSGFCFVELSRTECPDGCNNTTGRCVVPACPSNFCEDGGYTSGSYCEGQVAIDCASDGHCRYEAYWADCEVLGKICRDGGCISLEVCDGVDNDGDGTCDEGFTCCAGRTESCATGGRPGTRTCSLSCTWGSCIPNCSCTDGDGDGYYSTSCSDTDCSPRTDCDDTRSSVHPGATEVCGNGLDDDCVGGDEVCPCTSHWACTEWSACSCSNVQTRACTDTNHCLVPTGRPNESQSCAHCGDGLCDAGCENSNNCGLDCPCLAGAVVLSAGPWMVGAGEYYPLQISVRRNGAPYLECIELGWHGSDPSHPEATRYSLVDRTYTYYLGPLCQSSSDVLYNLFACGCDGSYLVAHKAELIAGTYDSSKITFYHASPPYDCP